MENRNNIWKPELYRIQMEAPVPKKISCDACPDRPEFYGDEYHGVLGHKEATVLLEREPNGAYLLRKGNENNDFYTLTWRFNDKIHHYKLYYDGTHYINVNDKHYNSIYDLVADGLITSHMMVKARHILDMVNSKVSYTECPYVTLNQIKFNTLTKTIPSHKASPLIKENINDDNGLNGKLVSPCLTPSLEENPLQTKYSKPHCFKVHTFKGLNWCELCANFLWGFTAQGVKCEDCGFVAHGKCSERVPAHCLPQLARLRGVFGADLATLLGPQRAPPPLVVRMCVREIEKRGLDSEGLYRVSGNADEVEALKMAFDRDGEAADLAAFSNINVVAGTLKLYLRLLPVPLVTFDVHPLLVQALQGCGGSAAETARRLRGCLARLPPAHYSCLQYVVQHLHRVSLRAEVNKMSAHNLSTVFAPTLVATPHVMTDLRLEIQALETIIEHCSMIF